MSSQVNCINYTENSFVVYGNTKDIKDTLKEQGGKWNANLTMPCDKSRLKGWVFSKTKYNNVLVALEKLGIPYTTSVQVEIQEERDRKSSSNNNSGKSNTGLEKPKNNIQESRFKSLSTTNIVDVYDISQVNDCDCCNGKIIRELLETNVKLVETIKKMDDKLTAMDRMLSLLLKTDIVSPRSLTRSASFSYDSN